MSRHLRGLRGATVTVVAALLAISVVAGCSSDGASNDSLGGVADGGSSQPGLAPANRGEAGDFSSSDSVNAGDAAAPASQSTDTAVLEPRALIKTGSVDLHSTDVGQVLDDITGIVAAHGGEVASESTTTNDDGEQQRSQLQLRVPVNEFEETLDEVADLGSFVSKSRNQEDVTTQVVDVDARVQSARDSLESLRRLFVRATRLGQVITLETQLAQRQADLESLLAQQKSLADQTAMSTISVDVARTPDAQKKPKADDDQAGFVAGIKQGWDAFTTFVVGTGHALGVALPLGSLFAVLALIGWVGVRRWAPRPHTAPTE